MLAGFDSGDGVCVCDWRFYLASRYSLLMIYSLNLSLLGWSICYAAFAINWSSLQYADHAWSELHAEDGAWNLRVNRVVPVDLFSTIIIIARTIRIPASRGCIFPGVDWSEPRPSFLKIYLSMWRGPRPLPESMVPAAALDLAARETRPCRVTRYGIHCARRYSAADETFVEKACAACPDLRLADLHREALPILRMSRGLIRQRFFMHAFVNLPISASFWSSLPNKQAPSWIPL